MNRTMFVLLALFVSGCSYTRPSIVAPMTLGPKERAVGMARGQASAAYFFGMNVGGEDSLADAIDNAKINSHIKADTMANVFVDRSLFCLPACFLPIYRIDTTSIFGTLVSYDLPADHSKSDGAM